MIRRLLGWLGAPFYGVFGAPLWLIARTIALALLGVCAGGAAAVLVLWRIVRRG